MMSHFLEEPDDRVDATLREHLQLPVVPEHIDDPFLEQERSVHGEDQDQKHQGVLQRVQR